MQLIRAFWPMSFDATKLDVSQFVDSGIFGIEIRGYGVVPSRDSVTVLLANALGISYGSCKLVSVYPKN